jgi:hypothetical protein
VLSCLSALSARAEFAATSLHFDPNDNINSIGAFLRCILAVFFAAAVAPA